MIAPDAPSTGPTAAVTAASPQPLDPRFTRRHQRQRRHPRPTQFDYLHLRCLVRDLEAALGSVPGPVREVLDVFCGSRPYDSLLPPGSRCVGLDIDNMHGLADVVTTEFLPFDDEAFDLVMCLEAFHYAPDPPGAMAAIRRVLRPGGTAIITVPLVWEYDRTALEHRYTGPSLAALLADWEDVRVVENGGWAVSWATLTGRMLNLAEGRAPSVARPVFVVGYLLLNAVAAVLDRFETRTATGTVTLPMNLLVQARRPAAA